MRRFLAIILCVLLLSTTASAENVVSSAGSTCSVSQNGSCQVALTLTIRLDTAVSELNFPLGKNVSAVSLNGGDAKLKKEDDLTFVRLSHLENQTGSFPLTIHYTLNQVVEVDEETQKQTIRIPMLYGFQYPVEQMSFSVSFPGAFSEEPVFYSGYHEQDIERNITYSVTGTTVTGNVTAKLKDSETLYLTLTAPEGMFPQTQTVGGSLTVDHLMMGIFAAFALLYWLFTMSRMPKFPIYRSTPPDGISAGVIGSYLVRSPADLTMMIIHWAQLGYLIIHLDNHGRVLLHKKMDMGNERNGFERRCFRNLFGSKRLVEATGHRYARLFDETEKKSRRYAAGFTKESGNPMLLRFLAALVGTFAGIAMGDCITLIPAWRVFWMILLGSLVTTISWQIQRSMLCLYFYDKSDLIYTAIATIGILVLGFVIPNCLPYAVICVGWSLFAGLLGAFGGRRNENGVRIAADLLGLRRYMRKVTRSELDRILKSNPNYYYELAPFAIAMGVDKKFAGRFENLRIPACNWLIVGTGSPRTAKEWYPLLQETVDAMNTLVKRPFWEKN